LSVVLISSPNSENKGSVAEKMKVAVSDGVKPCLAREREKSSSRFRVAFHSLALISSRFLDFSARKISARNRRDCSLSPTDRTGQWHVVGRGDYKLNMWRNRATVP
jgi:hypothetical protein